MVRGIGMIMGMRIRTGVENGNWGLERRDGDRNEDNIWLEGIQSGNEIVIK